MNPKQIATEYLQKVWVERNFEALDNYIASDLIQHTPTLPNGSEPLKSFLSKLFTELMPGMEWRILRVIADGDLVAAHSLAMPAPGKPGMVVVDIYRIEGGKIVEHWDVSHEATEETVSGNTVY